MVTTVLLIIFLACLVVVSGTYFGYPLYIMRYPLKNLEGSKGVKRKHHSVSIVIPTYNEENVIKKKLENILSLINPHDKMEIIVVDDGSTDSTVNIVKKLRGNRKKRIKLISCINHQGKSGILNVACKVARGEIIVVTDADIFLTKESIDHLISHFSNPMISAVCGKETIINPHDNAATKIEYHYRNFFHSFRAAEKITDFPPLPFHGGLMAFRKEVYTDIPLDTIGDDHEIAIRIWRSGYKVIYDPNSIFLEYATRSLREIYEQKRRRARGVIQCIIRNKDLLFKKEAGSFGSVRFPILALEFIVCPFALLLGFASLISYSLLVSNVIWFLSLITLMVGAIILIFSVGKRSITDIPYMIFGLFLFQVAMAHAVIDILVGTSTDWKKIMGQRPTDN